MTSESLIDLDEEEDEGTGMSLADIYNRLLLHSELIFTIPADQEDTLRKGLASVKAKQNAKLREAGVRPDPATLSYITSKSDTEGAIDLHITLSKRTAINVIKVRKPDPEF